MFTINKKYGIGKVESTNNGMVTVYFADEDVRKTLVEKYTTIYATEEEAERALSPEMTEEEANTRYAAMKEEERIMAEGTKAQHWLEQHNIEASKKLMRNI